MAKIIHQGLPPIQLQKNPIQPQITLNPYEACIANHTTNTQHNFTRISPLQCV
jgi:hypothetical protein